MAIGGIQGVKNICFSAKTYFLKNISGFRIPFTEVKKITVARICGRFSAARYVQKWDFPFILYIGKLTLKYVVKWPIML